MSTYSYSYTRISRPTASSPLAQFKNQPLLTVGLSSKPDQYVKVLSYIDTGAQWCLFSNQYAKQLGIGDYKQSKEIFPLSGIGGPDATNIAYFHDLKLLVFKDGKNFKRNNAIEISTKIGFVDIEFGFGGILGVYGFLDQFIFTANVPKGYFELTPMFSCDGTQEALTEDKKVVKSCK